MIREAYGDGLVEQRLIRQRRMIQPPHAKWLTTFNDLITLLMVFFVLVFAMSKGDMAKIREFRSAIIQGFGSLNKKDLGNGGLLDDAKPIVTSGEKRQKNPVPESIRRIMEEIGAIPNVATENRDDGMVIRISGELLFESGSAAINPKSHPLLKKIGRLVTGLPNRIRIEGHTDNVPISTGKFPSNWELSAARSVNIVKFLLNRANVHPRRLSAVGYGESRPIRDNSTPENRALNRRVEIFLLKDPG